METEISDTISIFKDAAQTPSPSFAWLKVFKASDDAGNVGLDVNSTWSMPDLVREESTKFTQPFMFIHEKKNEKLTLITRSVPCDTSSVFNYIFDNSGRRTALLRKSKKNGDSVYLEIWNEHQKEMTFNMTDREEHGKIYEENGVQSFMWSKNGKYLIYIAEAKQKKSQSFFKDLYCLKTDQKPNEELSRGEENLFRETWGESHTDMHHSVLCTFEVDTGKVKVLDLDDKFPNLSVAQAAWGPDDKCITFVGYKEAPSRLGLVYCKNRRSAVYCYYLESNDVVCLTPENISVESPVFTPDLRTLVYFQNKANGPHASCRTLMKIDWSSKEVKTVVDIVHDAKGDEFAGLYFGRISTRHFTPDGNYLFFTSYRRSYMELFCVDVGRCKDVLKVDIGECGSCVLHDVVEPYILISVSSPNVRPHLKLGIFDIGDTVTTKWHSLNENSRTNLKDISWKVHTLAPSLLNKNYPNLDYDIITIASEEKKNGTLIIFPHGGPHSVLSADYYKYTAAFARLGYVVCLVNYRGSIGFGENSILSLLGNVGTQDVSDVINAIDHLKKDESLGVKNVVGFGGSHGGFLIAHLVGQYPDLLKAAVIRNPVIDLSTMAVTSDIPDWCWIESGCASSYDPLDAVNPSILETMWEKSPIKYVKNVKTPTLLCLGKNDLRVPPSQGLLFHRHLKAQNVPTKVCMYDDGHALAKVSVFSDVFMQTILWFQSHLSS